MPRKYDLITELYKHSLETLTESPQKWEAFLRTAANNYKYSFRDQVLIFAQRPDATACAEFDAWHNLFDRRINRGATGIALIADKQGYTGLRHVFDVSDTYHRYGKALDVWTYKPEYESEVVLALENSFGDLEKTKPIAEAVISTVENAVEDNATDYLNDLLDSKDNSFLEELDELNVEKELKELLKASVAYASLLRLGIVPELYFAHDDFEFLKDFNTPSVINILGCATSDITEMCLRIAERTVRSLEKNEKKEIRTFDAHEKEPYNNGEKQTHENGEIENGSNNDLQREERSAVSESRSAGTEGTDARQVRDDAQRVSDGASKGDLHDASDRSEADGASLRNRTDSEGADFGEYVPDGSEPWGNGEDESRESDDVGSGDEQHQGIGGGRSSEQSYFRVNTSLPGCMPDVLIAALRHDEHLKAKKGDIVSFLHSETDDMKKNSYIKSLYQMECYTEFFKDGAEEHIGYYANDDGLTIYNGAYLSHTAETSLSWDLTRSLIEALIKDKNYLDLPKAGEQMTLMDMAGDSEKSNSAQFSVSQEVIDELLRLGGCTRGSTQRIYGFYRRANIQAENVEFLKREYQTDSVGLIVGDRKAAASWDKNGILIAEGEHVYGADNTVLLSWEAVDKRIRELLEAGIYIPQTEADKAAGIYDAYVANRIADLYRDHFANIPDEFKTQNRFVWPEITEFYQTILTDKEKLEPFLDEIAANIARLKEYPSKWSYFGNTPEQVLDLAESYMRDPVDFPEADNNILPPIQYVSQDKIDQSEDLLSDPYEVWDSVKNQCHIDENGNKSTFVSRWQADDFASEMNRWVEEHPEYDTEKSEEKPVYDLGFGYLGNGLTVYNKAVEVNGDYPTVAHIDDNGEIKYYSDNLPDDVIASIEKAAEAERQKHEEMPTAIFKEPELAVSKPESLAGDRHNYRITDDEIIVGGAKEKFRRNLDAINLLHQLELEKRYATPEEQKVFALYTGWGGLADAFNESKTNWSSEYKELNSALSPEEYSAARESTLTAFYTPPVVIKAMYQALSNMGFRRGNILEPSCGVGNFIGMKPEKMNDSRVYGVELDSISGRIAKQLYQEESITVDGFEKTQFPDSFFDVAIGNVPFGQFKVGDKKYDKHNFLIHDYFFAKAIDKVRPGGVIAFITSKGTLDKENPSVRKYIAQRADLIGAIRLPNTAFKGAGTEVTSDIIFLQKRDSLTDVEPDWVHLGTDDNGVVMNQYFIDHTDMIMGEMVMQSGQFGPESTCRAYEDEDLAEMLNDAISNLHADIPEVTSEELDGETGESIPADPSVRNYSFALIGGKVYYRQNSVMNPVDTSVTGENRIKGMITLRDIVRKLIDYQMENYPDESIEKVQAQLNREYDNFVRKYGIINSRANAAVFSDDNSYYLLCSLEIINDKGEMERKADMFNKRTINPRVVVDHVDTASEALAVSLSERAKVDIDYMCSLTGMEREKIIADLDGIIFRDVKCPTNQADLLRAPIDLEQYKFVTADEYLSGNVREKLRMICALEQVLPAEEFAKMKGNKTSLQAVQPQDLSAADIGVRLGSTWVPQEDVQQFVYELLGTPYYLRDSIEVKYIPSTAQWLITGKNYDRGNIKSRSVYGTGRINGYNIIEETLNLKDVRIFDYVEDEHGNKKPVINKKETTIAQGKQEQIKRAFEEWIWKDPERRERLTRLYNDTFNSTRPREFCGDFVHYYGMNPEITLRQHQKNAVARIIYGGNTLLAHVVGAGKTFTMVAAAQESKRLGLCSKSMFVVPNHLIGQWASEYLQLYPSANILVANKKDFETKNRKKFCARIATGDYDAIIIGHSQFEKIPVSLERQRAFLQAEIDELIAGIQDLKNNSNERLTVKQLEKARKGLQAKLDKLNDQSRKDNVIDFEQLGIDRIFVDEAHMFKNLFVYTKMRNVAGISQTEAQKSSDLYMKCRYLDENTEGKGVIFATGTPISNSMTELYTMQRYLQYTDLKLRGLASFDAWASTFGETVTAIELSPEGTGYRAKTRFAKFFNIPELMAMFKEVADVQTADMLDLPVPEAHYRIVKVDASDIQKDMVQSFAERAEKVRAGMVNSSVDNMLVITNDGRKAALDQRLINPALPDYEGSKVNACLENVYRIWQENVDKKSSQLVFCDLSTPHGDGKFNVYDDIREKLISKGVPPDEIAFVHNADTDVKKKELFAKVRSGQVRILLGSTAKMGAGTNVQKRLIANHDLDCPWRPSDLEQRAGRIVRQGNSNPDVDVIRYVTTGTFDAYMYQLLETKQKFISQIMTSKSPVRSAEDVDEMALSYAEIKAIASGNPKIMEKMQLDADVAKLKLQKASHLSQRYSLEDKLMRDFPKEIKATEERIAGYETDMKTVIAGTHENEKGFSAMVILGETYPEKADAGKAILEICKHITNPEPRPLGLYRGLQTEIGFDTFAKEFFIVLKGSLTHRVPLGQDANGIITRLDNAIEAFETKRKNCVEQLDNLRIQVENAKAEVATPFPDEAILQEKSKRLDELNAELNMDKRENEIADDEQEQDDKTPDSEEPDCGDDRDDR